MFGQMTGLISIFVVTQALAAPPLPAAPTNAAHPGSKIYSYQYDEKSMSCASRQVTLYLPRPHVAGETFPVVIYGHGQALDLDAYRGTFEHLAGKGVAVIFPTYDTGFFDQDWTRMGRDYVSVAACVIQLNASIAADQTVFSGHSKGAYVASVAAGLAEKESLAIRPRTLVLFESAGVDKASIGAVLPSTSSIVIYADRDKTVDRQISEDIFNSVRSFVKRFIFVKSYTTETASPLLADHFFPLTKGSFFGGGNESALHYYGAWKWLVAAAEDLRSGGGFTNEYVYGAKTADKGVSGFNDDVK